MKHKAFTITELLVVIAIIAILLAMALPALSEARIKARVLNEQNNISNLGLAVETFRNDHGYYPESGLRQSIALTLGPAGSAGPENPPDRGAHRLYESLMGLDGLGFQEEHYYDVNVSTGEPIDSYGDLTERHGPYMQTDTLRVGAMFEMGEAFAWATNPNPVFLDSINRGQPRAILYYRANRSKRLLADPGDPYLTGAINNPLMAVNTIYDYRDNAAITEHVGAFTNDDTNPFANYIWDTRTGDMVTTKSWINPNARPYKADSFLLIGAGRDGLYGTEDDITNFTRQD